MTCDVADLFIVLLQLWQPYDAPYSVVGSPRLVLIRSDEVVQTMGEGADWTEACAKL